MAGGHGGPAPVKIDPAVEAWASMRENVYKTFKFTPSTTRASLVLAVGVPLVTYYIFKGEDAKWDWQGKKRADSLKKAAPATTESS